MDMGFQQRVYELCERFRAMNELQFKVLMGSPEFRDWVISCPQEGLAYGAFFALTPQLIGMASEHQWDFSRPVYWSNDYTLYEGLLSPMDGLNLLDVVLMDRCPYNIPMISNIHFQGWVQQKERRVANLCMVGARISYRTYRQNALESVVRMLCEDEDHLQTVKTVLDYHPELCSMQNDFGCHLLHVCRGENVTYEILSRCTSDILDIKNEWGHSVMSCLVRHEDTMAGYRRFERDILEQNMKLNHEQHTPKPKRL